MTNEMRPEGIRVPSGPRTNDTLKSTIRQGVIFGSAVVTAATGGGLLNSPSVSEADISKCPEGLPGFTLLEGDCDPNDIYFSILLAQENGGNVAMAERLGRNGYGALPEEFKKPISIVLRNPQDTGKMECDIRTAVCSDELVKVEIDKGNSLLRRVGRAAHKTIVLGKSRSDGVSSMAAHLERQVPSIYQGSRLFMANPANSEQDRGIDWGYALGFIHEAVGHSFAGIPDNEGHKDVMDHMTQTLELSPQHQENVRRRLMVGPYPFLTPKAELQIFNTSELSSQGRLQSSTKGVVGFFYAPIGSRLLSEVIPFNNDGPGEAILLEDPEAVHAWGEVGHIVDWNTLLPDMTYKWKVRTSNLLAPGSFEEVPGSYDIKTFHTEKSYSDTIALKPLPNNQSNVVNPTLEWANSDDRIFYYEVQVSKDPNFNTDPATANSMVYWELRHGGVTNPKNSYTIPAQYPLQAGAEYFWRVRPRVQGDGTPVPWSNPAQFTISANATATRLTSENIADFDYGNWIIGPSQADLDRANTYSAEPITPSPLARILHTANGEILIPEEGAEIGAPSKSTLQRVDVVEYRNIMRRRAYASSSRRSLSRSA